MWIGCGCGGTGKWRRRRTIGGKICRAIDTMWGTAEVADVE
jgi:hypothetical protein